MHKCLHLSGRHLAGDDTFCLELCPELPFLSTGRLKAVLSR
ncbi:hypothetical protein CES85_3368 (plasmid) [Ochrobactrum quorumnocens]|uniref:Uncharacterized protein n=1 Tax=Ochrobactrum quorumnocens TaxID=271865 RepID=A0A248UNG5_9HYPH|nr:hypothetical protein CES85_3368 [[Ochrobactrum] quorumnocens]